MPFFFSFPWISLIWGCFLSPTLLWRTNYLALDELCPRKLLIRHIISFLCKWLVLKNQKVRTCHKSFTTCEIFTLKLYSICSFINFFYHSTQISAKEHSCICRLECFLGALHSFHVLLSSLLPWCTSLDLQYLCVTIPLNTAQWQQNVLQWCALSSICIMRRNKQNSYKAHKQMFGSAPNIRTY